MNLSQKPVCSTVNKNNRMIEHLGNARNILLLARSRNRDVKTSGKMAKDMQICITLFLSHAKIDKSIQKKGRMKLRNGYNQYYSLAESIE